MKKLLTIICASVLVGALAAGCGVKECAMSSESAHCVVYVNTTPGEESVLLAKSRVFSMEERIALWTDFAEQYGAENVKWEESDPYHRNCKRIAAESAVPDCYELTLTVDVYENYTDLKYWFLAKKIDGRTRIYKFYEWAFTEDGADGLTKWMIDLYEEEGEGEIISSDIKNLGPEIHDMPIEF